MKRIRWRWIVLAAAYGVAFAANVGHFAWSYKAGWLQILASVLYAVVWIWFVVSSRNCRAGLCVAVFAGGLTAVGGIFGLLARTLGSGGFTLLGLATAGLTATPLYGLLSLIGDYDLFYLAATVLGIGFCTLVACLRRR